ncbi:MAG: SOS response-associated peptidase [Dehalococcoidia bacterium]|nr:MAG: SOS response-associated peptidase [Dehalococcoidia bacterium]
MCYYVSITPKVPDIELNFKAKFVFPEKYKAIYVASAFTFPFIPVISNEEPTVISFFQWGLVPSWVKNSLTASKIRTKTLNARAETVFEKPSFKHSILSKRCLVLVDGFYEWRHENKKTYPYYVRLRDEKPFALAGIWDSWTNQLDGKNTETFSIVTTRANSLLEKIHNTRKRMPVILTKEDESVWLDNNTSKDTLISIMIPYDDKKLKAHTVSRMLRSRGLSNSDSSITEEYNYQDLQPLS